MITKRFHLSIDSHTTKVDALIHLTQEIDSLFLSMTEGKRSSVRLTGTIRRTHPLAASYRS
jgi:hypothetical protein